MPRSVHVCPRITQQLEKGFDDIGACLILGVTQHVAGGYRPNRPRRQYG